MFGRYAYHRLARRENKNGDIKASTTVSAFYATSSSTSTGAIAGYSTLSSSSSSKSEVAKTETSIAAVRTTTSSISSLSSSTSLSISSSTLVTTTSSKQIQEPQTEVSNPQSTQSTTATQIAISTQQTQDNFPATETPAPPQPLQTEVHDTTLVATEVLTSAPVVSSTSAQPAKMMVTSLEDLPQSIVAPTSSVPKSMSLLVASSSTPAVIMSTFAPKPSNLAPSATPTNTSPADTPSDSSMNASGKVSLILGIVLFLATGCIMYQLYYRRKQQAARAKRTENNEKSTFNGFVAGTGVTNKPNNSPHMSQNKTPPSAFPSNLDGPKPIARDDQANPFGTHAEIVVDSVNAHGPKIIDKVESLPPTLARGASKRGAITHRLAAGDAAAYRCSTTTEYSTHSNPANSPSDIDSQSACSPAPAVYRVQLDFNPSMDDELELRSGQLIRVLHEFDDGWAMCIRLDCSEQGVCPRTCLSTRPMKPRSKSNSTIGRQGPQIPLGQNKLPRSVDNRSLPTSPQELPAHRVNVAHQQQPMMGPNSPQMRPLPQVPMENQSPISTPNQGLVDNMIPQSLQTPKCMPSIDALPLKNAARFVAPTHNNPHNSTDFPESVAPIDYFSFSKPSPDVEFVNNPNISAHEHNVSIHSTGSELGDLEPHMSQELSGDKSVPGQAL